MIHCHSYLFCCSNSPDLAIESPFKLAPVISSHVSVVFQGLPHFLAPQAAPGLFCIFPFSREIPAHFFQEALVPGESILVGQTSCSPGRGPGEKLTHPLQCPRKRRMYCFLIRRPWGGRIEELSKDVTFLCPSGHWGAHTSVDIMHLWLLWFGKTTQTALCVEVCPRFSNTMLSLGCPPASWDAVWLPLRPCPSAPSCWESVISE